MSKTDELDDILQEFAAQIMDGYAQPVNGLTTLKEEAKVGIHSYIRKVAERIIDTSKEVYYAKTDKLMDWKEQTDLYCEAREDLRAEQREQLERYFDPEQKGRDDHER